jgi:hypothetical protein
MGDVEMIGPLSSMLAATNLSYASTQAMFGAMDAQAGLAAAATPTSNPVALGQMDKAFQLQGAQAKTNYLVAQSMQTNAQRMLKQHEEERRRLMELGVVLV